MLTFDSKVNLMILMLGQRLNAIWKMHQPFLWNYSNNVSLSWPSEFPHLSGISGMSLICFPFPILSLVFLPI